MIQSLTFLPAHLLWTPGRRWVELVHLWQAWPWSKSKWIGSSWWDIKRCVLDKRWKWTEFSFESPVPFRLCHYYPSFLETQHSPPVLSPAFCPKILFFNYCVSWETRIKDFNTWVWFWQLDVARLIRVWCWPSADGIFKQNVANLKEAYLLDYQF